MQNHNGWYGIDLFMLIKAVETAFGLKCKRRARDDMANQLFAHDKHRKYEIIFLSSQFRNSNGVLL